MRRAVPSFTVEVRRRPRLATTSNPDAPSSETKSPQGGFDRESHRAAAAAFEAKKADPSPVDVASSPKGRILPSLVPEESLRRALQDAASTPAESEPPSRAPKRPRMRTSNGKDQTSKLPRNSSSRPTRMRRWLRDRRPRPVNRPVCNQMTGQALRQGIRRVRQVKLSESPAVYAERKGKAKRQVRDLSRRRQGQAFA